MDSQTSIAILALVAICMVVILIFFPIFKRDRKWNGSGASGGPFSDGDGGSGGCD